MNNELKRYMELDFIFFMQVAGYSLEELKELFSKGYALTPPSYTTLMEELEV